MKNLFRRTLALVLTLAVLLSCLVTSTVFTTLAEDSAEATTTVATLSDEVAMTRKTYTFDTMDGVVADEHNDNPVEVKDGALVIYGDKGWTRRVGFDFPMCNGKTYGVSLVYKIADGDSYQALQLKHAYGTKSWIDKNIVTHTTSDGATWLKWADTEYAHFSSTFTVPDGTLTTESGRYYWLSLNAAPKGENGADIYLDSLTIYEVGADATIEFDAESDVTNSATVTTVVGGSLKQTTSWGGHRGLTYQLLPNKTYNYELTYHTNGSIGEDLALYSGYSDNMKSELTTLFGSWTQLDTTTPTTTSGTFTTDDTSVTGDINYLWLRTNNSLAEGEELYIDSIRIYEAGGTVAFDTLTEDITVDSVTGGYRQVVTLPTPVRYGYDFEGWYSDAELTTAAKAYTNIPAAGETVTFYAKWTCNHGVTFDFSDAAQVGNAFPSTGDTTYATTIDDETLHITTPEEKTWQTARVRFPYVLKAGQDYTLTLKYKGDAVYSNVKVMAGKACATYGDWTVFGGNSESSYVLKTSSITPASATEWSELTINFTADSTKVGDTYKYLGLSVQPATNASIYIDDVTITEAAGKISFDTLTDEVSVEAVSGTVGEAVTLPTPVRYGYNFDGWYYDSELTMAAENATVPYSCESYTLYAKWSYTGDATFDFSNAAHLRQSFGTVSITDEQLTLSANANSQARALLPFVPQTGKSYTVTLKYRSEHATDETATSGSIDFNMNLGYNSSGWTMFRANESTGSATLENTLVANGGTKLADLTEPTSDDKGEWKTLSYTFTMPDSYATKDVTADDGTVTTRTYKYLGFWIQPSSVQGTLYIDDIVISEADEFNFSDDSQVGNAFSADITDGALRMYATSGSQSRARLPFVLENEKVYKVSLKYKAGVEASYDFRFYAAKALTTYGDWAIFGGNSGESSQLISYAFAKSLSADGEWVTAEYVIFPKCVTDTYKYLGLWMQPAYTVVDEEGNTVKDTTVTCELYIDDVAVTEMGGAVIINYNDGATANKELIGYNVGEAVVLPTPTREGYNFDGWYSDAELTNAVGESYTVIEANVNLYAKWAEKVAAETPAAPTIAAHTQDSVTLTAIDGYEYSMDGQVWQSESVFTGLITGTQYSFYQRVAETETALASAASAATVYTIVAHGDANGDGTINALDLTIIRKILLGEEVEYNADGANANGDDVINLKDLVCAKKAVAAQAATATLMAIDNVDITAFSLSNSLDSKTGNEIEDTFTSAVTARTGKELAPSSDNIIEISIDEALESDTYKIYVENGNMYITATSEYVLLEAIRVLSDRISDYPTDRTLNLQDGYTFEGKYLGITVADKYSLVWNDEFNGTALDSNNWTVNSWTEHDTWIDRENETDGSTLKYSDEYITVSDGAVHLGSVTVDNGDGTYSFYGSDIRTRKKMTFSYGYFEARMKLPGGVGQWSAFWANGYRDSASTNANDYSTEIDVIENFGYTDKYQTDLHVWGNSTVDGLLNEEIDQYGKLKYHKDMLSGVNVTSDTLASEYHTYGCEWTDTSLKLYFDGTCYYELVFADFDDGYVNSTAVAEHFANLINGDELELLLTTGSAPGHYNNYSGATVTDENYNWKTEMTVDYVRLYQLGGKENLNYK